VCKVREAQGKMSTSPPPPYQKRQPPKFHVPKFVQITAAKTSISGVILYALDEKGHVWQRYDLDDRWSLLPDGTDGEVA
jgi:hypothetical protein